MPKSRVKSRRAFSRNESIEYLLEQGNLEGLKAAKQRAGKLSKYYWNEYSELARQRNAVKEELEQALIQSCISDYEFKHWQRAVKYKYGLHPLSTLGSLSWVGGRFNIGEEINSEVTSFPALYLASDKDTALQEHLGQQETSKKSKLTPRELALTNPSSETIVSVSGCLDKVFDLTEVKNLTLFVNLIKNFVLSGGLKAQAKQLNLPVSIMKTTSQLLSNLLIPEWRLLPVNMDIPSNSQIFGHLIYSAGIEGILYPSKLTKKPCLAIFPRNFSNTDSTIYLDDEVPHKAVPKKVDSKNWRVCELSFEDILSLKKV